MGDTKIKLSNSCCIAPLKDFTLSLKLVICYVAAVPPILLRSAVGSTKLIGQLHWALFIVVLVYLFTCLFELDSNNKRADANVSSI